MKNLILFLLLFLVSCSSARRFEIHSTSGDRFSNPSSPIIVYGSENRISKRSTQKGIHLDNKGVFFNPFYLKNKSTEKVEAAGFNIVHRNFEIAAGFNPIKSVTFLADGKRIEIAASSDDWDFDIRRWNSYRGKYDTKFIENSIARINIEDLELISRAKYLEVKVLGGKRNMIYEQKNILESFQKNLLKFIESN